MENKLKGKVRTFLLNLVLVALAAAVAVPVARYGSKIYYDWKPRSRTGDFSKYVEGKPYKITLYGTSTCMYCKSAREYLIKSGVEFNDLLVDKSSEVSREFDLLGEDAVPVLLTNQRIVKGFKVSEYDDLLKKMKQS